MFHLLHRDKRKTQSIKLKQRLKKKDEQYKLGINITRHHKTSQDKIINCYRKIVANSNHRSILCREKTRKDAILKCNDISSCQNEMLYENGLYLKS